MSLSKAEEIIEERRAYKHEPSLTVRLEGEEGEKPQKEVISEKEAQIGLAKTCEAVSEEISQKEEK
ncbi:MAG: hypothetical protein QXR62_06330 [Candidatus Bathyarchaeia archaeon]